MGTGYGTAAVAIAMMLAAVAPEGQEGRVSRPPSLGVQATIVFLYDKDGPAAQRFYEDIIGVNLVVDQGFI
jgi:hypothetical protein